MDTPIASVLKEEEEEQFVEVSAADAQSAVPAQTAPARVIGLAERASSAGCPWQTSEPTKKRRGSQSATPVGSLSTTYTNRTNPTPPPPVLVSQATVLTMLRLSLVLFNPACLCS